MCMGKPKVPEAPAARQAAKAPNIQSQSATAGDQAMRRLGMSATILTGPRGAMGAPNVVGKALLGS